MNWKTTLAGIAGGMLLIAGPPVGARLSGDMTKPPITMDRMMTALAIAAVGALAKDHDLSGGTRKKRKD